MIRRREKKNQPRKYYVHNVKEKTKKQLVYNNDISLYGSKTTNKILRVLHK